MFDFIKSVVKDLFWSADGKGVSQTKFWSNIAYSAGIAKFLMIPIPTPEVWAIVLGVIGAHAAYAKYLATSKAGANDNVESDQQPS